MQGLQGYCMTAQSSVFICSIVHALNYLHTLEVFLCALPKLQWNAKKYDGHLTLNNVSNTIQKHMWEVSCM